MKFSPELTDTFLAFMKALSDHESPPKKKTSVDDFYFTPETRKFVEANVEKLGPDDLRFLESPYRNGEETADHLGITEGSLPKFRDQFRKVFPELVKVNMRSKMVYHTVSVVSTLIFEREKLAG